MRHLSLNDSVCDLVKHPAFAGFGEHFLPQPEDAGRPLPLSQLARLMPWHAQVRPELIVAALNNLIDRAAAGEKIFYSFYESELLAQNTGLFYFPGRPGAPLAVLCPGGGFVYLGTLHEGLPMGEALSRRGYHAFVLQYRLGGGDLAGEDLAAALNWIFRHSRELGLSTAGYSVWGGSAGARLAAAFGSYGPQAFGAEAHIPRPAMVVMAYSGHGQWTIDDPPTFAVGSDNDLIAPAELMERRVQALKSAGIESEFRLCRGAGHGFGLGVGTAAEGWLDEAIAFWERQLRRL